MFNKFYKNNKKLTIAIATIAICVFATWSVLLVWVVQKSGDFYPQPADAIVVLGHAVDQDGNPSPWLVARLQTALQLYNQGYAPYIILTGGIGPTDTVPVSYIMADYITRAGVPYTSLIIENGSNTTYQNFNMAYNIAKNLDIESIIVVTNGFHLYRSTLLGSRYFATIHPASSPTKPSAALVIAYMREPLSIAVNFAIVYLTSE